MTFRLGVGRDADDARSTGAAVPRRDRGTDGAGRRAPSMAANARRRARGNARRSAQRAVQRLAPLSDARVPAVGAQRLLPIRRRIRISRSVAGRPGAGACRAASDARTTPAVREPAVRRRRRPALVASAVRARRAHAVLGRLPVAAAGDRALRARDRRHRRPGRAGRVPRRPAGQSRRRFVLRPARPIRRSREPVRPWRARDPAWPALRQPRLAADGLRRLERRDEPRRHRGQGRERLARVLPLRGAGAVRGGRAPARRRGLRAAMRRATSGARARTSKSTAGTASGIAARTSTTVRRSARRATPNAGSIRSRRAGRCCPASATRSARARRWMPSIRISFGATTR